MSQVSEALSVPLRFHSSQEVHRSYHHLGRRVVFLLLFARVFSSFLSDFSRKHRSFSQSGYRSGAFFGECKQVFPTVWYFRSNVVRGLREFLVVGIALRLTLTATFI